MNTTNVGLIGLGNMGTAVAGRLASKFEVMGFDPSQERRSINESNGVSTVSSPTHLLECPVILLSLPRPEISAATIRTLVDAGLGAEHLVVETSTVLPSNARSDSDACRAAGAAYVEAAILSGVKSVAEGTTTLLLGGADADVARGREVLEAVTAQLRHLGPVGAGMAAKVVNNAVAHDVYVVLSEAVALAESNGIGIDVLVDMFSDPEGGLIRPLTHRIGERLVQGNFDGGMSVDAALKDSQLALAMAQQSNVPLFATQSTHAVYEIAAAQGLGRQDYSAVATLWRGWRA